MSYNSIYDIVGFNNEVNRLETQAKLGWKKEFRTLKMLVQEQEHILNYY